MSKQKVLSKETPQNQTPAKHNMPKNYTFYRGMSKTGS